MCGLVAIVGRDATRARAEAMSAALRHRGPDDAGAWTGEGVALAHRRLAILDLSAAGHQPMVSHDGRYHLVYNGEIYNYAELAAALPGVAWRGRSDTEVLLELFARRGPACLDELAGMFAFAVWDAVERRLFCARDRAGIKPLYYARLGDGWAVASEIGALLAAGVPARADEAIVYDFLARDYYEHADATFFAGVAKLAPGHWTWLAAGEDPAPVRYWDLAHEAARVRPSADRTERGEQLIALLQDAVRLGLRADVPLGIAMSGGLDSAVLLALIDRAHPDPTRLELFSFDFDDARYGERLWVEAMAAHTGHAARFRTVTPADFTDSLDGVLRQQQEPHAGAPIAAYTQCFEALRARGAIVVMDGSGLDEALAGYDVFRPARWADLAAAGDHVALEDELAAAGLGGAERELARAQMVAASSALGEVGQGQDLTRSARPELLHPALARHAPPLPAFERPFPDFMRNRMYRELRYTKLPRALRFRDRLSMAYGCELRPPFLDHRVLAYAFALPPEDHLRGGATKALLRDAAARLLPDTVRLAAKRSVQTPQREWFRGPLAAWVRAQIDRPALWDRGWVERGAALDALDRFLAGDGDNSFFVWQWIALARWAELFLDAG